MMEQSFDEGLLMQG